jgi:50S ribosomal protein L16 3-hydroxylase
MRKVLEALISPKTKSEFLQSYENNIPFVVHGLKQTIRELTELPFLKSLDDLLNSWPQEVEVHLPKITDEANAIQTAAGDAKKMFENGMGLLFNDANNISPLLTQWLEGLRLDMGLSALTYGRNLIYATKVGKGTSPHFDQNMNFVIQIHGSKKWWVAPNQNVENPLTRFTMGLPMDPELEGYASSPMPAKMPGDASEFKLEPGSMLFVPRGSWHCTEAITDALSLNFTFTAPTWIDIFSAALRSRLSHSPEWRQTANYVSFPERSQEAVDKFNGLLTELSLEAADWRAEQFLSMTESADS